jgi:hypothetical protein
MRPTVTRVTRVLSIARTEIKNTERNGVSRVSRVSGAQWAAHRRNAHSAAAHSSAIGNPEQSRTAAMSSGKAAQEFPRRAPFPQSAVAARVTRTERRNRRVGAPNNPERFAFFPTCADREGEP